jgi:chromosome segregation ATPase
MGVREGVLPDFGPRTGAAVEWVGRLKMSADEKTVNQDVLFREDGWDAKKQTRLDVLRASELADALSEPEQRELAELIAEVEAEEKRRLAPALERIQRDRDVLLEKLRRTQADNEQLAALVARQEQMRADARRALHDFERRHQTIREMYYQVTGEALIPTM